MFVELSGWLRLLPRGADGEMGAAEICSANSYLLEMSRQTKLNAVLLDIMGATMMVRPDEVPRIQAQLGTGTPQLQRLAIALKPEDDRGLIAGVAKRLGIEYRQFGNLRDAEVWVASGGRP